MKTPQIALLLTITSLQAGASINIYNLKSDYTAAAGYQEIVDFNYPELTTSNSRTYAGEISFKNGIIGDNHTGNLNFETTSPRSAFIFQWHSYAGISVDFSTPVYSFSADIGNWLTIFKNQSIANFVAITIDSKYTYQAVGTYGLVKYPELPRYGFFGITSSDPIKSIHFEDITLNGIAIDNLSYSTTPTVQSIPEPPQMILMILGIIWITNLTKSTPSKSMILANSAKPSI